VDGNGLAGMYCGSVGFPLKQAEASGLYGEAFGVNDEWVGWWLRGYLR